MHLRRALLLFALVLGLTAVAASIAPPPEVEEPPPPAAPPPPDDDGAGDATTLAFRAPPEGDEPAVRRIAAGEHIVVEVSATRPGEVSIPRLGRLASVTETVPARFNMLAPDPGRYEVMYEPFVDGEERRIGVLVTES